MHEPHPLFTYGPLLFFGASFVVSAAASPLAMRLAERRWFIRRRLRARFFCLLGSIALFWVLGTIIGLVLLAVPPTEREGRLPADHVDAAVLAHVVPTIAPAATEQLVRRLENGGTQSRWDPSREREARLVLAARIDLDHERAVDRLYRGGYRTHAGRFASAHPTAAACIRGLDALAEAMRGGALKELMSKCRNTPGDHVSFAAFKVGDFMGSVGPETESIISRQPRTPVGEPGCWAEGPDVPDPSMPACRLVHGELHRKSRRVSLEGLELEAPFATRWMAAIRAELGEPLPEASLFTIDPVTLVDRPFAAVIDEPIAVYEDIREHATGALTPGQSGWVRLAVAAERSAMGRHADASKILDEAREQMAIGAGASDDERAKAARLAVAIAIRARDVTRAEARAKELSADDPLLLKLAFLRGDVDEAADPTWSLALATTDGPAIAAALDLDPSVARGGLWRLARVCETDRPVLREWLRETFPACEGCGFFTQLDRLVVRLDAGEALHDVEFTDALRLVVARFEAVFLERTLALSLRAADPAPLP